MYQKLITVWVITYDPYSIKGIGPGRASCFVFGATYCSVRTIEPAIYFYGDNIEEYFEYTNRYQVRQKQI